MSEVESESVFTCIAKMLLDFSAWQIQKPGVSYKAVYMSHHLLKPTCVVLKLPVFPWKDHPFYIPLALLH